MKNFKDIIREVRLEKKIILRQVASATEIDQTIINKFELGERKPSREQVIKIADYYCLNKDELIIAWKSDLVYNELKEEKFAKQILKVAEQKIKYGEKGK